MKENERCRHPDCEFRASENPHDTGNCNYSLITGKCRTVGLPERLTLPCNCPRYVPRGKGAAVKENGLPHQRAALVRNDAASGAGEGPPRASAPTGECDVARWLVGRRRAFDVWTAFVLRRAGALYR